MVNDGGNVVELRGGKWAVELIGKEWVEMNGGR